MTKHLLKITWDKVGVKYETGVTADKRNNVQFITIDSETIKWE
jgi:hypothetical protein